jgi:hypothetical protein
MSQTPRRQGIALGTVLSIITLAMLCALVVATAVAASLNLESRNEIQHQARDLSDSALAAALEQTLQSQGTFGMYGLPPTVSVGASPSPSAVVTFDTSRSLPFSTNNLQGSAPVMGYNRQVPAGITDLIATTNFNGLLVHSECLMCLPPYAYAIGTSGTLIGNNMTIEGVVGANGMPSDTNVRSNGAIQLTDSTIYGNVAAASALTLNGCHVTGAMTQDNSPVPLPTVPIEKYDPLLVASPGQVNTLRSVPVNNGPTALTGYCRAPATGNATQNIRIASDLHLDEALLWVNGNVEIDGKLSGCGAIMATGDINLMSGSQLTADNQVALAAHGSVTLQGRGANVDTFYGVVYCEGAFTANQIALTGAFVSNSSAPGGGTVNVADAPLQETTVPTRVLVKTISNSPATLNSENPLGSDVPVPVGPGAFALQTYYLPLVQIRPDPVDASQVIVSATLLKNQSRVMQNQAGPSGWQPPTAINSSDIVASSAVTMPLSVMEQFSQYTKSHLSPYSIPLSYPPLPVQMLAPMDYMKVLVDQFAAQGGLQKWYNDSNNPTGAGFTPAEMAGFYQQGAADVLLLDLALTSETFEVTVPPPPHVTVDVLPFDFSQFTGWDNSARLILWQNF